MFNFFKKTQRSFTSEELKVQMVRYSDEYISFIKEKSNQVLDYNIGTLELVEITLKQAHENKDAISEDKKFWIVSRASAYISEVARKKFGGKYYWHPNLNQPVLTVGEPNFKISLLAFLKVKGRIENGIEDNIPFFFLGFIKHVEDANKGDDKMII